MRRWNVEVRFSDSLLAQGKMRYLKISTASPVMSIPNSAANAGTTLALPWIQQVAEKMTCSVILSKAKNLSSI
jgi:hypothetical protein